LLAVHYEARAAERLHSLLHMALAAGVPVQASDEQGLTALAGTPRHQGVVAIAGAFPYAPLESVIAGQSRLLVVADHMQDPHNLGALMRTAAAVGVGAVIVPRDGAVPITATVEAAAAGAAALVPVCRVTNVARTLESLKEAG
jgi:23S rRNA (guanosine2251-2'-O)-methyltransferase